VNLAIRRPGNSIRAFAKMEAVLGSTKFETLHAADMSAWTA